MLYAMQTKLLAGAVGTLVLIGIVAALFFYGYHRGQQDVQAEWDAAVRETKDLADKALQEDRDTGYQAAVELQHKLSALESKYDSLSAKYRSSLRSPVVCPASGEVGDVMLPGDLVDSLFVTRSGNVASGTSASGTDRSVR